MKSKAIVLIFGKSLNYKSGLEFFVPALEVPFFEVSTWARHVMSGHQEYIVVALDQLLLRNLATVLALVKQLSAPLCGSAECSWMTGMSRCLFKSSSISNKKVSKFLFHEDRLHEIVALFLFISLHYTKISTTKQSHSGLIVS